MPELSAAQAPASLTLSAHLQQVTEALAATTDQDEALHLVLQPVLTALNASAGAVLLVDVSTGHLQLAATEGHETGAQSSWQQGPLRDALPAWDALQQRQALFFEHPDALVQAYPGRAERPGAAVPVSSAMLPMFLDTRPLGTLMFDFQEPHTFPPEERQFLQTLAAQCAVALGRAQVLTSLRRQVAENEALTSFARFTELSAETTDLSSLIRRITEVLYRTLGDVSVASYDLEQGFWCAKAWSDDVSTEAIQQLRQGFPQDTPRFAAASQTRQPTFLDSWEVARDSLAGDPPSGSVALLLLFVAHRPISMLSVDVHRKQHWTDRGQGILRAVGRSLGAAPERASQADQLLAKQAELEGQNRALEAFSQLAADLSVQREPRTLIRRALETMMPLLPQGYAAYWELRGGHWYATVQVNEAGNPELQQAIDAGLPTEETPTFHQPFLTREPYFQSSYDQGIETPPELVNHIHAVSAVPVIVGGRVAGLLNVALFEVWTWDAVARTVLITAAHSLGLALERAEGLTQLAARSEELEQLNAELQAANEELEAFTYSASHDLRTPVRHVMGFAELAEKAIKRGQYEKVGPSLNVIKQGALRMTALIDGMLILSRSGRQQLQMQPVDLNVLVMQARQDAAAEFGAHPVHWQIGELPTVQGDGNLLQQVMTNLLSNAVKYSAKRAQSEISVWSEENDAEWTIQVQDNGVGFDPEYSRKLFGIFQRLHTEQDFKGTGVGLATMRRIVQKHGGQVFAQSDGQTGATFGFSLPKCH